MEVNQFPMCIDCVNKQSSGQLPKGKYYCPYVKGIFPDGIVSFDIDATECVRNGIFREIDAHDNKRPILLKMTICT